MRILLLEDDKLLGEGIKATLEHFSYSVDWITEGKKALLFLKNTDYGLMILDLGLPDIDGLSVLENIRHEKMDIPVLVLTARDQITDKIAGLDGGADDYMVKPFDIRELEARIRTLTRRANDRRSDVIDVKKASLNLALRSLDFNSQKIEFSRREFCLIRAFFESPGKVFTRESLESISYNWDEEVESNALEVHVHHLRKKLGDGAIKTVRGVGYRLVEDHFD